MQFSKRIVDYHHLLWWKFRPWKNWVDWLPLAGLLSPNATVRYGTPAPPSSADCRRSTERNSR